MKQLVNKIHHQGYPDVAGSLQALVDGFKFEDILKILDQ
jgi:hypothetical protein